MGRPTRPYYEPFQEQREEDKNPTNLVLRFGAWFKGLGPIDVFTGLLVFVGAIQVWTFVRTERAYISLDSVALTAIPAANQPIVIRLDVKNDGRTTAFVTSADATFRVTNVPLPKYPEYVPSEIPAIAGPLVAGSIFHGTLRPQGQDRRPMCWIATGLPPKTTLYVYGYIKYKDGFWPFNRTVGFCVRYAPEENPSVGTFSTCDESNYRYGD